MLMSTERRGMPRRVVGRVAIAQSLARVAIRLARFANHRATSRAEIQWACRVGDRLRVTLDEARRFADEAST